MNAFQTCRNTVDAVPLYLPQQLFLKPIAKLNISIQLPNVKKLGVSISHWEIMEKLRDLIKPEEFSLLKVAKTTVEIVRLEAELEDKNKLEKVVTRLENRTLKLKDIPDLLRIRAAIAKSAFPSRHAWDNFFQEAKDMNEMKPGERPDTIHITKLPIKWFVPYHQTGDEDLLPSEKIFYKIFEKFGNIRYVDIPKCDPYRSKMKDGISGIKTIPVDDKEFFEGYVQFKDYIGFTKAMDYLRNMKLLHKDDDETLIMEIKVDFDRSKHLSDASIRRREIVRERLVRKQKEKEEKERDELEEKKRKEENERKRQIDIKLQRQQRRRIREEKRKAKILDKLKIKGADEINEKIAKEEKKLLKVQRKLEAIRLVEELFKRINERNKDDAGARSYSDKLHRSYNELQTFKNTSELEVLNQREILHNAIKGRVMLKTILSSTTKTKDFSSSDSDDVASRKDERDAGCYNETLSGAAPIYDPNWYGYPYHPPSIYPPPIRGHPAEHFFATGYQPRGRSHHKMHFAGPSRGRGFQRRGRGFSPRYRGAYHNMKYQYPPELEEEYRKYFSKFLQERDGRTPRSRSVSQSRSRSRSRSYSPRRSRSRRRSYSRSRRSYSKSHKSRSNSRSYSRYLSRSRSRSRSHSRHSRSSNNRYARSRSKSKARNRSNSNSKSHTPSKRSSRSNNEEKSKSRSKERNRSLSVDSSKFISPNRMRNDRSKSWSMPRSTEKDRGWSKSPKNQN